MERHRERPYLALDVAVQDAPRVHMAQREHDLSRRPLLSVLLSGEIVLWGRHREISASTICRDIAGVHFTTRATRAGQHRSFSFV